MASLKGVEDVVPDAFSLINQEPGRTPVLAKMGTSLGTFSERERAGSLLLRATGAQKLFEAQAASQLARERPVASELTFGASFKPV